MPSFIKGIIWDIRHPARPYRWTYYKLGERLGSDRESFFPDLDDNFSEEDWTNTFVWDGDRYQLRDGVNPTATLCHLFKNESHPSGDGDLVRQIPTRRRYDYACGIAHGIAEG